jgi:hypothetical protein
MDGDDFSRAHRLGRMAAEAIWETVSSNAPFDGFATGQLIDRFIAHAGGIPSLKDVLAILADLASQPLFVQTRTEEALAQINDAVHGPGCTPLDLQLGQVVASAILRNEIAPQPILERYVQGFIERNVIMARGGFVETYGLQHIDGTRDITLPIARAAAEELIRRPDAKQLGLSLEFLQRLDENSNLLGVA